MYAHTSSLCARKDMRNGWAGRGIPGSGVPSTMYISSLSLVFDDKAMVRILHFYLFFHLT